MRRLSILAMGMLMVATQAVAQQQQPSANERALGQKLFEEFSRNIDCRGTLFTSQDELIKLKVENEELKKKLEEKK